MRRIYVFGFGITFGVLACLGAMNLHLVRAEDGFHVVRKQRATLSSVYVDTRQFSADDWASHSELVESLRADNQQKLVNEAAPGFLQSSADRLTGVPQQQAR